MSTNTKPHKGRGRRAVKRTKTAITNEEPVEPVSSAAVVKTTKRTYKKSKLGTPVEGAATLSHKTRIHGPARWDGSSATIRRLQRELVEITTMPPCNCTAWAKDDSLYEWGSTIAGPDGSPYEGGVFHLGITFPPDYPFKPPKVVFKTKIYHCNIDASGTICLDILKDKWTPALTASKVLLSVCSLLTDANPADPLVVPIAKQYRHDREEHDEQAREWTKRFATV